MKSCFYAALVPCGGGGLDVEAVGGVDQQGGTQAAHGQHRILLLAAQGGGGGVVRGGGGGGGQGR